MTELGLFDFSEDGFSEEERTFGVQPCNWQVVQSFIALATQWRVGMLDATRLGYGAVAAVIDCHGIKPRKRKSMLREIRTMEIEVLAMWAQEHE